MSAGRSWSVRRYLRRACACGMGPDGGSDAVWAAAVLRRVSQAGRPLRSLGGGLSVDVDEPERACQTRYSGHPAAGDPGRASALRAHHRTARRRGERGAARDASGDERALGPPGAGEDRRGGRGGVAAAPSRLYVPAVVGGAVDPRCRYHGQAALRSAGGRRGRLQSAQAGPAVAHLPHLCDRRAAADAGGGSSGGEPACLEAFGAGLVGVAGAARPHGLAVPVARRL